MNFKRFALAVLLAGAAAQAPAAMIAGSSLQNVLNNITVGSDSSVDVQTDQMDNDEMWSITGSGGSVATIVIELAGYAGSNSFGIYDVSNPANFVEIMGGSASQGDQAFVSIKADGSVYVNNADTTVDFADNLFGYYLNVAATGNRFYSQQALNADGVDHLAAFQGNDSDIVQLPNLAPGVWTDNEYVLAFEDLWGGGDRDFTDFVAMVESVTPVPAPASLALLGLALAGLTISRRRKAA
ncbi:MAG: DUF4114 domain-containing protein [Alcanivoracaceae bacterium]|jgi:hypothetical protein|nr:DUF4114 domain-containing protein [Alcanivoracaceae bacterium]